MYLNDGDPASFEGLGLLLLMSEACFHLSPPRPSNPVTLSKNGSEHQDTRCPCKYLFPI